jgi:hypothetical protein
MQRKSTVQRETKPRVRRSGRGAASSSSVRQVSRWMSAYDHALVELALLLADAAELRALYHPTRSQR